MPSFYGQSAAITRPLLRGGGATVALGNQGAVVEDKLGDHIPDERADDDVSAIAVPDWSPALQALLTLELSGKWPEDLAAFGRIKSSFLTNICKCLQDAKVSTSLTKDSVKALQDGFVFELKIAHPRELALLKRDAAVADAATADAATFQRRNFSLPHIASVINALNAQFPAFSATCRIFKRWTAAQLLIDFFPEEGLALELIVAYVFLHPHPYGAAPVNPQAGFLRVLRTVSTWNWKTTPMILNLNEELTAKDYRKLHRKLTTARRQQLDQRSPSFTPMFIATPYDKDTHWTATGPPAFALSRLVAVATASFRLLLSAFESDRRFLAAFHPPLDGFNVLIRLRESKLPTRYCGVDCMEPPEALTTHLNPRAKGLMPVNGFDPARRLVQVWVGWKLCECCLRD